MKKNKRNDALINISLLFMLGVVGYFVFYKSFTSIGPTPTISVPVSPEVFVSPTQAVISPTLIPITTQKNTKIITPIPTIDPDPVISCSLNEKCGGGTISMRRSECSNTTCCEIAGKWVVYKDRNQCTKDQETYWNNYYGAGNNYVAPTYAPIPIPTYSIPTYSPPVYVPSPTSSYQAPTPNYAALLQNCRDQANEEYNLTMRILRANGTSNSSSSVVAEQKRNSKLQQCQNLYGN